MKPPSMKPPAPRPPSSRSDLRKHALVQQALQQKDHSAAAPIPEDAEIDPSNTSDASPSPPASTPTSADTASLPFEIGNPLSFWDSQRIVSVPSRSAEFNVYEAGPAGRPVILCIHGGGYTGLTWSPVAKILKDRYRIVAPDLRGHGLTEAGNFDLSAQSLAEDVVELWVAMFGSEVPRVPTVLVGHSMGGAAAVWGAATKRITSLEGLVVIDVVEGTALAALPHMTAILSGRPTSFPSQEAAVTWALKTGMSRCREAAAVSVPSQLQLVNSRWEWRTPLADTRQYWEGWYTGLSVAFLGVAVPKILLLAGTDRLDRELTIGQMQGKFQLVVLPAAGHAVHEDEAAKTADSLLQFATRFRIGEPPMQFPRAAGARPVLPVVAGPTA